MKVHIAFAPRVTPESSYRPYRSQFQEYDFVALEPCSVTDPVFIVSANVPVMSASIAYINDLGKRFYTITSKVRRAGGMWEVHMHSHPLMSMIRYFDMDATTSTSPVRVQRTPTPSNSPDDWSPTTFLVDEKRYLKMWQETVRCKNEYLTLDRDANIIQGWDDTHTACVHMWSAWYTLSERCFTMGFTDADRGYRVICGTLADLYAIIATLCSTSLSGVSDQALAKFYGDPLSNIKFIRVMPCFYNSVQDLAARGIATNVSSFKIGYYQINRSVIDIPVHNPMSTVEYGFGYTAPKHPQFDASVYGRSFNLNRQPYNNVWFNLPPYGKVPVDGSRINDFATPGEQHFVLGVWNQIDLITGEGRLYLMYRPNGYGDDWMKYAPKDLVATCPVCQEVPIMALVQNVSAIRSSELGLAKLDTQKNLPQNKLLGVVASAATEALNRIGTDSFVTKAASTLDSVKTAINAPTKSFSNFMYDRFGDAPEFLGVPLWSSPTMQAAAAAKSPSSTSLVNSAVNTAKEITAALDTTYNFKLETAQYQTQLNDARAYPQTNVAGNAGGSLWFQSISVEASIGLFQQYWLVNDNGATTGYGACVEWTIRQCLTTADTIPTWEIIPMSDSIYSRGGEPLLPSEMSELQQVLTTGCTLFNANDGW